MSMWINKVFCFSYQRIVWTPDVKLLGIITKFLLFDDICG